MSRKKLAQSFPLALHDALKEAYVNGDATIGYFKTEEEVLASTRLIRRFLQVLGETPLHASALLLHSYPFRNSLTQLPGGEWLHTLKRGTRKVLLPNG